MRQERAEGPGGGLLVPMAWMRAEYIADELLRGGHLMPPSTLEYRAGRGALALTIFLSEGPVGGERAARRVAEWRSLTEYGSTWRAWVCERLDRLEARAFELGAGTEAGQRTPDLELASATWRWLEETELLAPDLDAVVPPARGGPRRPEHEGPQAWTPAWQLGLPLGHLAMHLY
ncbi:hypothetical protein [Streptomyces sp. NBC_01497]|uniref:hypothetical protein n=1 Tax=Streptomyces sp. NBC_01497 TaxID=2903885 RepID=UPI002E37EA2F|nr:hypothetical protein [Streptomyces sp. NBC_01497]